MLTVYSKPDCVQCDSTYRALDRHGVSYRTVDVTQSAAALAYITEELGYAQAPVCVVEDGTGEDHWCGFRPDRIARLAAAAQCLRTPPASTAGRAGHP
ncbi:glutaredoxin domain-containing protein [Paenarthrobacter ureafaciens]|uniref:glutaredoxin domain-containing protein n=1 Tax=Paenarthrobacter ureafaciens TaxID=37931 RepID=UPI0034643896